MYIVYRVVYYQYLSFINVASSPEDNTNSIWFLLVGGLKDVYVMIESSSNGRIKETPFPPTHRVQIVLLRITLEFVR